jgi:hypothetical protein
MAMVDLSPGFDGQIVAYAVPAETRYAGSFNNGLRLILQYQSVKTVNFLYKCTNLAKSCPTKAKTPMKLGGFAWCG